MKGFRAWLELMRFSNAPTIITNVLVGWAVAKQNLETDISGISLVGITVAMLLFYAGGMMLNDVVDVEVDRRERAGRVIPSGRVSRKAAGWGMLLCLGGGIILVAVLSWIAIIPGFCLLICIVAYNLLHKKYEQACLIMGLCRGLVYVTTAFALTPPPYWEQLAGLAGGVTGYITGTTWLARNETIFPRRRYYISYLLAGICLIDALFLLILAEPILALAAVGCFLLTRLGHRFISGT